MRCDVDVAGGLTVKRAGGTRCYLAPEAILQQPVSAPCDWWALGVLLFELLTGALPFRAENDKALGMAICNTRLRFPREPRADADDKVDDEPDEAAETVALEAAASAPAADAIRPALSPDAVAFVRKLLSKKSEARLGIKGTEEVRTQPFFRPIDWLAMTEGRLEPPHVPEVSADTDVRHFDRKHTSQTMPLSAAELDATSEAEGSAAAAAKVWMKPPKNRAVHDVCCSYLAVDSLLAPRLPTHVFPGTAQAERLAELVAAETQLADKRATEAKAAEEARRQAAAQAVEAAKASEMRASEDAAADGHKRVRNVQKKVRQVSELQEALDAGKALNVEQKKKIASAFKLQEELQSAIDAAAALDAAHAALVERRYEEDKKAHKVKAAEEHARAQELERAEVARQVERAKRDAELRRATAKLAIGDDFAALSADTFAYLSPQWK